MPMCASRPATIRATETRRLVIVRMHHGTPHVTAIDADLLASGDYAQIRAAAEVLQGLIQPGATVKRGDKQQAVGSFKEALDWLLDEARSSVSIQRYKGLGEMNPEQLWETTMDPAARRLLRVQIEDAITVGGDLLDADGRAGRAAARVHRDATRSACAISTSSC